MSDFFFIGGPCVIEGEAHALRHAKALSEICRGLSLGFIYKSSYDKANRTSGATFRGPGLKAGLKILAAVKKKLGCRVLTDVHSPEEAKAAAKVVDVLQIPAMLCRQTDLVVAAAKTGRTVNIKKGQFMDPWSMKNILEKATSAGAKDVMLTERGASFGYQNLVVDFRSIPVMKSFCGPLRRRGRRRRPLLRGPRRSRQGAERRPQPAEPEGRAPPAARAGGDPRGAQRSLSPAYFDIGAKAFLSRVSSGT
jgi:2-dehydro-3-deoxyphosphooctonate aldolase (KDO 8-P synthase)